MELVIWVKLWISWMNVAYEVLFLDAKDNVLIKRYKETGEVIRCQEPDAWTRCRRTTVTSAIAEAGGYIWIPQLLIRDLKREITSIFVEDKQYKNLYITVLSFQLSMVFRVMQIWSLMYVFCLTLII
ncbi:MAG: hypothetical protein V8S01_06725 [Dorea sp.]